MANYLAFLSKQGLAAKTLALHKSAVVTLLGLKDERFELLLKSSQLQRLLKGAFLKNPSKKQPKIWNVTTVLDYLRSLGLNEQLGLKNLFWKALMLLALVTACRMSELASMSRNIQKSTTGWTLFFNKLKKNSSAKTQELSINVFYFTDPDLCPLRALDLYIVKTHTLVPKDANIFTTLCKPFRNARPNTLAKHIKEILGNAGVDTEIYKAHSVRSASTSHALARGISIEEILDRATWASDSTFVKFYAKEIVRGLNYSNKILE
jgi:integrase